MKKILRIVSALLALVLLQFLLKPAPQAPRHHSSNSPSVIGDKQNFWVFNDKG